MYAAHIIARVISQTTGRLFLYPGGTIAPLLHECKALGVDLLVAKTEQGAGFMAIGQAQLQGKPAFVAVTSGPGATNLITCIADAYYDSVPLIVITGQVGLADLGRSPQLRQRGFQEVPIVDMVGKITKQTYQPKTVMEMAETIHAAYRECMTGRPGPVLIDLPMSVQLQSVELDSWPEQYLSCPCWPVSDYSVPETVVEEVFQALQSAQRPLLLLGGGAQSDWLRLREWLSRQQLPCITSLRALGVLPAHLQYGWIGHTGMPWANSALHECDCLLVLGSRLDVRQTGTEVQLWQNKRVFHVDIDDVELSNCRIPGTRPIKASVSSFIAAMGSRTVRAAELWQKRLQQLKASLPLKDKGKMPGENPAILLRQLSNRLDAKAQPVCVTTGVGSHQHWVARHVQFDNARCRYFTSAGHGTMGFGLPTAIGIQIAARDTLVINIDGDGSFQMNPQELAMLKQLHLAVKIVLLDNNRLGIVSQFQQITFGDDPTTGDCINPDFVAIAKAYGLSTYIWSQENPAVLDDWLNSAEPALLYVRIAFDTPIAPMLLGGKALDTMWPYAG